jgi:hypothetical protein
MLLGYFMQEQAFFRGLFSRAENGAKSAGL